MPKTCVHNWAIFLVLLDSLGMRALTEGHNSGDTITMSLKNKTKKSKTPPANKSCSKHSQKAQQTQLYRKFQKASTGRQIEIVIKLLVTSLHDYLFTSCFYDTCLTLAVIASCPSLYSFLFTVLQSSPHVRGSQVNSHLTSTHTEGLKPDHL